MPPGAVVPECHSPASQASHFDRSRVRLFRSRQIRLGNAQDTRGTAFVVFEDIYDAKTAVDHLSGFNVCGRYLVVLYYQQTKMEKRRDTEREMKELQEMRPSRHQ